MDRAKVWKVLIGVRERRSQALEADVRTAIKTEQAQQAQVQAAEQTLATEEQAHAQEKGKLLALSDPGQQFDVLTLMLREHVLDTSKEKVQQRQGQLNDCNKALTQSQLDLQERRRQRMRNQQKIGSLQEHHQAWQDEQQRAQDDQQDEEAEEAAIARAIQSKRAQSQAPSEGPATPEQRG
jgi:hypothetical protein